MSFFLVFSHLIIYNSHLLFIKKEGAILDGCSLNLTVSALACAIAKGKSNEELSLLSAFFTQLGDSLETISAGNALCSCNDNEDNNGINIS